MQTDGGHAEALTKPPDRLIGRLALPELDGSADHHRDPVEGVVGAAVGPVAAGLLPFVDERRREVQGLGDAGGMAADTEGKRFVGLHITRSLLCCNGQRLRSVRPCAMMRTENKRPEPVCRGTGGSGSGRSCGTAEGCCAVSGRLQGPKLVDSGVARRPGRNLLGGACEFD